MNTAVKVALVAVFIILLGSIFQLTMKTNSKEAELTNPTDKTVGAQYLTATFKTNMGDIKIELFWNKAPATALNFVKLAETGFYDGTRFHRVIKDFMIQGGDPLSKDLSMRARWGTGGPGYTFKDEQNDENLVRGIVAMANSGPDTNGSQFFIVTAPETPWLNGKHTPFAKVLKGLDVVMKIQDVETGQADQPVNDVIIEKVILE